MNSIFIVTEEQRETRGHGDFGNINKLSTYDGYSEKQYPAFKTIEEAQKFIDEVSKYSKPQITELPIWNVSDNKIYTEQEVSEIINILVRNESNATHSLVKGSNSIKRFLIDFNNGEYK